MKFPRPLFQKFLSFNRDRLHHGLYNPPVHAPLWLQILPHFCPAPARDLPSSASHNVQFKSVTGKSLFLLVPSAYLDFEISIVFLHGIGIGLWLYVNFLAALNNQNDDGEVGIIEIEMLSISFRIKHPALVKEEMCRQIENILLHHGFDSFVFVTHS